MAIVVGKMRVCALLDTHFICTGGEQAGEAEVGGVSEGEQEIREPEERADGSV